MLGPRPCRLQLVYKVIIFFFQLLTLNQIYLLFTYLFTLPITSIKLNKVSLRNLKLMIFLFGAEGVESVSLQGEDSSQIVVVGNDIDSVHLTSLLRKKVGSAELMSLSTISFEGDKQQEPKHNGIQSMVWPAYQASVPYYYTYDVPNNNQDSCTIM